MSGHTQKNPKSRRPKKNKAKPKVSLALPKQFLQVGKKAKQKK